MKQTTLDTRINSKRAWTGGIIVIIVAVTAYGLMTDSKASAQDNVRGVDSMYTCIDTNSKKAARATTSSDQRSFRTTLSENTLKGVTERKSTLEKDKFSDKTLGQRYQKLDALVSSGNKALGGNKVVKPNYHLENIKAERNNLLTQLSIKSAIASDPNTTTDQLVTNHCETSWGLRIFAAGGRKWQAQTDADTLSTRNAVAKAYWIAAEKPKGKDPAQFDEQIVGIQNELDALIFPRTGIVGVSTLNPKNGDSEGAFKKHVFQPQKTLSKKIGANSQQLKKAIKSKTTKPTEKNRHGYVQLPVNNDTYYIYGSGDANTGDGGSTPEYQRYGKPALVKMFQKVATQFHEKYPETKLVAGDLNAISGHESHKNGIDIDVYAQNYMATDMRGKHRNNESVERSVVLGKLFMDTKKIDVIFYNDASVIRKVNAYAQKNNLPGRMEASNSSHEFHFHVRIKGKPGPYDSCAKADAAKNCFR